MNNLTQEEREQLNNLLDKLSYLEFQDAGVNLMNNGGLSGSNMQDLIIASIQALQGALKNPSINNGEGE